MHALYELQRDFAAAVFNPAADDTPLVHHCAGSAAQVGAGIAAYRRSVLTNLASAVEATYPVLQRIVGAPFLAEAARQYTLFRPSTSGDLNAYGGDFDAFLRNYAPAAELPWLAEVAHLEWLVQQVYSAADASPPNLAALHGLSPERWGLLRFVIDPAHAILSSSWPLARIWAVNRPDYSEDMSVDFSEAQTVLIHRRGFEIAVEPITPAQGAFLQALATGCSLSEAIEATEPTTEFDLQESLTRFLSCGLLRQAIAPEDE